MRFPTDGKLAAAQYSQPNNATRRLPAIAGFLAKARRELGPTGVFLGADVFGYTAFNENDTDIGQRIEELAPHLDYICPMVYPSGYHLGIPGVRNPVRNPYEIVKESVRLTRKRSQTRSRRCGRGSRTSRTTRSTSASSASGRSARRSAAAEDGGRHRLDALESRRTTTRARRSAQDVRHLEVVRRSQRAALSRSCSPSPWPSPSSRSRPGRRTRDPPATSSGA